MNKGVNGEANGENVVSGLTTGSQDLNKNSPDKQSAVQDVSKNSPDNNQPIRQREKQRMWRAEIVLELCACVNQSSITTILRLYSGFTVLRL